MVTTCTTHSGNVHFKCIYVFRKKDAIYTYIYMDGTMDGWNDGWVERWMDG